MTRFVFALAASASIGAASACPGETAHECAGDKGATASTATVPGTHAFLLVDGVHCHGTASAVQTALAAVPGVTHVEVDAETGRADVAYDAARVDVDDLLQAVGALDGFRASVVSEPPRVN